MSKPLATGGLRGTGNRPCRHCGQGIGDHALAMSDARSNYEREICSPYRRLTTDIEHTPPRRIVLLRRSDGTDRNSPRDMPQYDGRGASTALLLACDRLRDKRGDRALVLDEMAAKQVEREQMRGCEAAE